MGLVQELFPANLRPMSGNAHLLSDLQPGWALLLLAGIGIGALFVSSRRDTRILALATVTAGLLYFPAPVITRAIPASGSHVKPTAHTWSDPSARRVLSVPRWRSMPSMMPAE